MKSLALVSLILAAPAAAQCFSLQHNSSPYVRDPWSFQWHSFSPPSMVHIDFVPFGGQIAVCLLYTFDLYTYNQATLGPLCHNPVPGCEENPLTILGWWWSDGYAMPGDRLIGPVRDAPVVDLDRSRSGFIFYPGRLPVSQATGCPGVGVHVHREVQRYVPPAPAVVAYFLVPERGWW